MKKEIKIITKCPSCESLLVRVKDQLFCRNDNCDATSNKKLLHFIKTMKIKGLGEKTVEKLGLEVISDIYNLEFDTVINSIGEKLGIKLIKEIDYSKDSTLDKFLTAFSIPLIGSSASKKLAEIVYNVEEIDLDICKKAGLGDKATSSLLNWITNSYPDFKSLPIKLVKAKATSIQTLDIKVAITGKLDDYKSRALAATYLESKGITVVAGVSKTLNYLINEDNKPSSKLSKANSYSIPIVTMKQLIEEINKI